MYDIFDKYGSHNCQIYLVETVNAKSKDELHAREGYHIRNTKCLNKVNPSGQTREEILEKKRQYRIDNKDKIREYVELRKEKVTCECGGSYTLNNRSHHNQTKKHLSFLEAEKVKVN